MRIARLVAVCGCVMALAGPSSTAGHAQTRGFISTCAQILMKYVGKPFAKGAVEAAGGEVAKYLLERKTTTINPSDVEQLQRRGLSECEIRQQVEAIAGPSPAPARRFSAQAHCSATGVTGTAHGLATPQEALQHAIYDCKFRGGVPACCERGAGLTDE